MRTAGNLHSRPEHRLRWCVFTVAQIFNLPYRRFVIGRASDWSHAAWFPDVWQSATLRYSRLQVCATGLGNTVNTYSGGEGWDEGVRFMDRRCVVQVVLCFWNASTASATEVNRFIPPSRPSSPSPRNRSRTDERASTTCTRMPEVVSSSARPASE